MKLTVGLCCLSVLLVLLVAWELTVPETSQAALPQRGTVAVAGARKAPSPSFDAGALSEMAAAINSRPLFSPDRRPAQRPGEPAAASPGAQVSEDLPRLTGVIVGPSGGLATFAGPDGRSRRAAPGDSIGPYRVREVRPGMVTLSGSDGDLVLRPSYVTAPTAKSAAQTQGAPR